MLINVTNSVHRNLCIRSIVKVLVCFYLFLNREYCFLPVEDHMTNVLPRMNLFF